MELTHLDEKGHARMVDVGGKSFSKRTAVAVSEVVMQPQTLDLIYAGALPKGDVLSTARIAAIMGAKNTSGMIPMCHPLPLDGITVEFIEQKPDTLRMEVTVHCTYKTGVEMEALSAASIGALTIYDMCKAVDKSMRFTVFLQSKTGGKSDYTR